jgi:pyruvate dehydrogenase E2 component (dihydrolipoamide acetyltransferase)
MQKPIKLQGRIEADEDIEIGQWHKQAGDAFKAGETLVEVFSNKATIEVAFDEPGTLVSILHTDGEVVSLDEPIAMVETEG